MRFLVICRPAAGGDQDEFKRLVPAETAVRREPAARTYPAPGPGVSFLSDIRCHLADKFL